MAFVIVKGGGYMFYQPTLQEPSVVAIDGIVTVLDDQQVLVTLEPTLTTLTVDEQTLTVTTEPALTLTVEDQTLTIVVDDDLVC